MERLTERDGILVRSRLSGDFATQNILQRLAEYEDAEEQGLLHKAPLKDGMPIWYIQNMFEEDYRIAETIYVYQVTEYEIGNLGIDFWTTKEEAEQKLVEIVKGGGVDAL